MENKFRENLLKAMRVRGFNQANLAEKAGLGRSVINQYCKGTRVAKQDRVYLLAKALNVSPSWLWGISDIMEEDLSKEREAVLKKLDSLNDNQIIKVLQMLELMYPEEGEKKWKKSC